MRSPAGSPVSAEAIPAAEHALVAGRLEPLIHHQDGAPVQAVADAAPKGLTGAGRGEEARASRTSSRWARSRWALLPH